MATSSTNVLEVLELTKVFKDFWGRRSVKAVNALNFDIRQGEVFGLLGPNGSGKTTCVRIVLGLLFPTAGAVRIFGRSPRNVDVKRRIGYMPEDSHLYPYLNAEETLDFYGRVFKIPGAERARRVSALIDMVGLRRARRRPVGQYSKGMARRIGLAQALINDPDFIILDEPTTGLDPIGTHEIKELICTLRERGKTVLLCSHLLSDVEEICDRVAILYGGRRRAMGGVEELLTAQDVTQIRSPRLDEATMQKVVELIRQSSAGGEGQDVAEISAPTKRLEDFFLNVVEQARRERLETAGAERGSAAADFLGATEAEGEELLRDLVVSSIENESKNKPQAPDLAEPLHEGSAADDELLSELVNMSDLDETEAAAQHSDAAVDTGDSGVKLDVLNELLGGDEGGSDDAK